jgi:ribosome-binding factor A
MSKFTRSEASVQTERKDERELNQQSFSRNARLEGEIRVVLTELLQHQVKDPRLAGVTVSVVRLSADRSHSRVYFSVIGDDERERQATDGFAAASPFLRRELGRRMRLRAVPSLEFLRDTSYEYGDHMERVFQKLHDQGVLSSDVPEKSDEGEPQ